MWDGFQWCCHDKKILFLIEVKISLDDILSMVLLVKFLMARKAASSAFSLPLIV